MALNKKYFKPEEINEIKSMGAEHYLMTAKRFGYVLSTPKHMNTRLAELYKTIGEAKPLSPNWGCGHCVLTNYKLIADVYYKSLEKRGMTEGDIVEETVEKADTESVDNNEVQVPEGE